MPIGKSPLPLPPKPFAGDMCGQDSTIDSRMSNSGIGGIPKMELLKVNYVHQCKQAIMHKPNQSPQALRLNNPARFGGYRRQPPQSSTEAEMSMSGRQHCFSPKIVPDPKPSLPPPTIESWQLLLQQKRKSLPRVHSQKDTQTTLPNELECALSQCCTNSSCSCDESHSDTTETNTGVDDCKKSQSWKYHRNKRDFQRAAVGIKSRADRIARIENREGDTRLQSRLRIPNTLTNCDVKETAPTWMFQKTDGASGSSSQLATEQESHRIQQKVKLERVHIRKKRQPLLIVNHLEVKKPQSGYKIQVSNSNSELSTCSFAYCSLSRHDRCRDNINVNGEKRFSIESCSDSGVSFSNDNSQERSKQTNNRQNGECVGCKKGLEKQSQIKKFDEKTAPTQMKSAADHNDVQNFANKNLTKVTTNELLKAAAVHAKQCNIEKQRNINGLNVKEADTKSTIVAIDDSWVRESSIDPYDNYMETEAQTFSKSAGFLNHSFFKPDTIDNLKTIVSNNSNGEKFKETPRSHSVALSSSISTSSSGCGEECYLDISSQCDSEQDCCQCNPSKSATILSKDCCNAVGGVFWNSAYNESSTDVAASCCCSISSCDEDDCSYYDGDSSNNIACLQTWRGGQLTHTAKELIRNKKLLLKTDGIHDLRPTSIDGATDSGISLTSNSNPDSVEHVQNQQDVEARRLKRGHVLTELLETERIYVTEMSSILKGYYDRIKSEDLLHLAPPSLNGKEDILFGNLHELYTFHNDVFLKDLENCISTTELVALCFVQRRDTFYRLYSFYCQNIPRSERLRETLVDTHLFLQECQMRLGHKLPLAAYLLKPVQRITKYQLLLKDLLRFSDSGSCTKELQKALDCMLIVLKCVNDSMHQVAITGFPTDLSQQGELLLQDSFQVWTESKKDIRLRIKPQQRHIFLYQKSMLFCKQTSKSGHNKSTYQFKHHVKMSQIGLTESVRGDTKRFEVWLQGRQEVHTLQAPTVDLKNKWVAEIKRVLLNQLEELKGEKIKQYSLNHRGLRQTTSWDTPNIILANTISCDATSESSNRNSNCSSDDNAGATFVNSLSGAADKEQQEVCGWSSDCSNSEDELSLVEDNSTPGSKFIALADYTAMGHSEVSMREGETVELLKVGCAGWWYVRILDANSEGWTPAAYLESINRKSSRSSSRNQERINFG
ncbi:rhoGEF domain-containing protein gxcJ isoform X8 [Drosophila miranda]|uniref:rhoGEF domain-containing protein gxcJ isoform X8 n=1 Tax=Drosophila miranda TaxID=7229 RepID=UPI0007E7B5F0|nr:rhoGEF domain-containing protein gxcJ isoform X8 [Drosophila miranda]